MRKPQGMKYSYPLLAFCLLLTELVGNRRQRQRATWLAGNWEWNSELAQNFGLEGNFESSPSQSTLSRFFSKGDEHAIKQLYLEELRRRDLNSFKEEHKNSPTVSANRLIQYCVDGKRREGCVSADTGRTEIDLTIMRADTRSVLFWAVCPDKEGEAVTARTPAQISMVVCPISNHESTLVKPLHAPLRRSLLKWSGVFPLDA